MTAPTTNKTNSLRNRLLIGASLGAMLFTGVAEAQDRSGGVFGRRGGGDPTAAAARAAQDQATRANATNSATQRAITAFRRAAETRQAMNDAQAAARAIARSTHVTVPNGMGPGGLQVANGVELDPSLWIGANGPVQSQGENGRTNVAIDQTQQRAILTWDSFNVGRETDLTFNQGGADWVALNRVMGNSADPSQILGSIKADGSVYIINQNGVIFGGASQVNVRNLIASSANITNEQFVERGIYSSLSGANYVPSFTGAGGAVTVEAGAQITTNTPTSVTAGGGFVLLMGTEVTNAGSITTPRGQTALSAGDDFIVRRGYGTEENQYSTTRGNEVRGLINAGSTSGVVTNAGLIEAAQGDITLAGRTIRQDGVLVSTTSVNQRGTIHLLNSASDDEGSVRLGADSLTIILPELDSEDTALNGQRDTLIAESNTANANRQTTITGGFDDRSTLADRLDQSRVEIVTGGDVVFEGGSQTSAQGGQVAVQANSGRITVEDGARIDVSGVMGVALDMEDNSIKVNIQGNEMRDSPANRDSDKIRSQDVWIDVRDLILLPDGTGGYEGDRWYTPGGLLEVGGHLQNMAHGIGEWAAVGGTITLAANEVVAQQGAVFDISGGSLDYRSGYVRSTRVMGADGRMYDIRNAPAHIQMVAVGNAFIRRHDRWGDMYTEVYSDPLFSRGTSQRWEEGYSVGRDAGRLILSAPTVIFEADVEAEVINGARQTNGRADGVTDGYKLGQHTVALGGSLVLGRYGLVSQLGLFDVDVRIGDVTDVTADLTTDRALPDNRIGTAWFDAARLNTIGLGGLKVETRGTIAVESGLTLADGGSVELVAPTIDIAADVIAHSGSIRATNVFAGGVGQGSAAFLLDDDGTAAITLHEGATLDLSGVWTNAFADSVSTNGIAHRDGGSVQLSSTHNVNLLAGSVIDVSSGAAILTDRSMIGGRGGDVALLANQPAGSTIGSTGQLTVDGEIRAYGVDGGGTLRIESGQTIVIGGQATQTEGILAAGEQSLASLVLAEDVVIKAGEAMPVDFSDTITRLNAGQAAPATVQFINMTNLSVLVGPDGWDLNGTNFDVYVGSTRYRGTTGTVRVVPAGSVITRIASGTLPAGYEVRADVFPNGLPIPATQVRAAAGSVTLIDRTLAAGTVLAAGLPLARDVAVRPALSIDTSLFNTGFSGYEVNSHTGLVVAPDAAVDVFMPVFRQRAGTLSVATGSDPADALELWVPPLYLENPVSGVLTRRAGADLALSVGQFQSSVADRAAATLAIARGASLTVDPGRTIDLAGIGQMNIAGTLNASGGTIRIAALPSGETSPAVQAMNAAGHGRSIWIDESAILDVAGRAFTAVDAHGHRYGEVLGGGKIVVGGALDATTGQAEASHLFVVVRDGAVLDASGAAATLDLAGRGATSVISNGGEISFASFNGLDLGGTWRAAGGGDGAAGGTLSVALEAPAYRAGSTIVMRSRDLVIGQSAPRSGLNADATPFSAQQSLRYGQGAIGAEQIADGGFDNVNLLSHGVIAFDGDVSLHAHQNLALYSTSLALAEGSKDDARIDLSSTYVRLAGIQTRAEENVIVPAIYTDGSSARVSDARFSVTSDLLDIERSVRFGSSGTKTGFSLDRRGFDLVELESNGDIRLTGNARLQTRGDLVLAARQVYPTTGATGTVIAGWVGAANERFAPGTSLTIRSTGEAPDAPPFSAFGQLLLEAETINQGGVLRAPFGSISLGHESRYTQAVNLLPGSVTSTGSMGLVLPYGGTVDGIDWIYAGREVALTPGRGVALQGTAVDVREGATIDLSGGGELTGAGFVSGRGGSVDTLRHPLVDANPGYGMSARDNMVYAIVPGAASNYAPLAPEGGAGNPLVGQQITLDGSIPGLPAGTYTLMPSNYALLPGAFRVEVANSADPRGLAGKAALPDGSYIANGRLGVANTGILESLSRQIIVTPADVVRTYSLYNETTFSEFAIADAARLGAPRPRLLIDGMDLALNLVSGAGIDAFRFDGTVDFSAAEDGYAGSVSVRAANGENVEVVAADSGASQGFTGVSLRAEDLTALEASGLAISARSSSASQGNLFVREGAILRAGEIRLSTSSSDPAIVNRPPAASISVEAGATLSTLGMGAAPFDSADGFVGGQPQRTDNGAMLIVSNAAVTILPADERTTSQGAILLGVCGASGNCDAQTTLYSEGTIAFGTNGRFELGDNVKYGARDLALTAGSVNIGDSDALAAADAAGLVPSGLLLNQVILDRLVQGDVSTGAPALQSLILIASDAVNIFGTVTLDTYDDAGNSRIENLVFGTPAIYGSGGANDVATIRTENLVWTGSLSAPGAIITGGAGSGSGTLAIDAERITFGYGPDVRITGVEDAARLTLGFASVNLTASDRITANNSGSLAVYRSQGAYVPGEGFSYAGGDLNISTPLLTGEAGSVNRITAGGAIRIAAPDGSEAGEVIAADGIGAELALHAESVSIGAAITLPSGRLTVSATGDIELTDAAQLDLAGREVEFDDIKKFSWGGEVIFESAEGDIRQAAGSTIDLSAENNHAGRLTAAALGASAGTVDLQGAIRGSTGGDYDAGGTIVPYRAGFIDIRAQRLGDGGTLTEQFAALNARLNDGEMTGGRNFQMKQGDLQIADGLNAGEINVSLDDGALTVTGTIDASGAEVGTIRLAANNGLTLTGTAVLDAHGETLRIDSYGKIIDSPNRAVVELNSGEGLLTLASGARIDLRHGTSAAGGTGPGQHDGAARGTLELNAPRLGGATGGDIAIDASGSISIEGARSIAVNAVQRYDDAAFGTDPAASGRPYQVIDQAYIDAKHTESTAFIDAALGNAALMDGKLAGLNNAAYRDAFHLRPGVEIVSATPDGDLVVLGDLDLSGHRYDGANPIFERTGARGSGEVGALTIRAGGDLAIYGSITDGFAPPPETPDDDGWILRPGALSFGGDVIVPNSNVTLADGTTYPAGRALNYDLPIKTLSVPAGTRVPTEAVLNGAVLLTANTILAGDIRAADGSMLYAAGTRLGEDVTLPAGTRVGAGFAAPAIMTLRAMVWPKGVPLPATVTLNGNLTLPMGGLIPSQANLKLPDGAISVSLRPADAAGRQGANWAVAGMLPAGSQSWSMRLVAGADLAAADTRTLRLRNGAGNLTLADTHFSTVGKIEGGGVWYWAPDNWFDGVPGTPVDEWALDPGYNVCEVEVGQCVKVSWVWAEDNWFDGVPGTPVDEWALDPGYNVCEVEIGQCVSLGGEGVLVEVNPITPAFSVVRTGTGDLDLLARSNIAMRSPYGVYTAGTQSQGVEATFNQQRATRPDGTVLGNGGSDYASLVNAGGLYQAWYPELGGDLLLRAGGDLTGDLWTQGGAFQTDGNRFSQNFNADPANWLWRQGDVAGAANGAAWWINFGTYVAGRNDYQPFSEYPYLVGFTGYGTLGGGDLRVEVGGDAGTIEELNPRQFQNGTFPRSQGLVLAVASTGRVGSDGALTLTGGGDMEVRIGGGLNPNRFAFMARTAGSNNAEAEIPSMGLNGLAANLRGRTSIDAGNQGVIRLNYTRNDPKDVRPYLDPFTATASFSGGGLMLMPGDSVFSLTARDDLVLGGAWDGGRTQSIDPNLGQSLPWFSLWTDRTAIDLFAAGGHLTPSIQLGEAVTSTFPTIMAGSTGGRFVYPAILRAAAPNGSIYLGASAFRTQNQPLAYSLMLAPSPYGALEMLAGGSIYAGGYAVTRSSADVAVIPTPFDPATMQNISPLAFREVNNLFAFGSNTASGLYDLEPARFYALAGDIVGLRTGELITITSATGANAVLLGRTLYEGGGATWLKAGRDIVASGTSVGDYTGIPSGLGAGGRSTGNLFVHTSDADVSIVSAGRDLIYSSFNVAGPGTLEISAGRNILMEDRGSITSIGPINVGDDRPGASIAMMAGMGASVDWAAIRTRYLDPANLADPERPLADQPGMAAKVYSEELADWLDGRYGFAGTDEEALAYFDALGPEQQRIFLRQVYFAETREGGREYNDPDSNRFGSYLRGREMIATLFPDEDAEGSEIERSGDIIMFGGAGVRTNFGGDIEMIAPGGQIVIGVQGEVPPPSAGVVTQGAGDIRLFSEQSILLGLSRILTTFGGDIFGWSEEGDINAGRGAKTTVLYTPPLRTYDAYGNVRLAPQVPSSGAGIGTLNPIPEVEPGDIDLIAPLGTIDAGEAGIRVSGNINLAALQVLNAANIQVQGEAAGIPTAVVVNTGALTAASSASTAVAAQAADLAERSRPPVRTEVPTILNVRFLGFGE